MILFLLCYNTQSIKGGEDYMYKIFTSFVENNQLIDESFTMNYIKSELNNKNLEKYNNGIYFNDKTDF